jgi:APA family basic amino acid/polyamine antiporter
MKQRTLTTRTGVGLVIANMIGAGVLLSTGFMAQEMGPFPIMLAWLLGSLIALAGVWAYSGVAGSISDSGGEYRYLSDLFHPLLGYLAGWGSLVLGFAAPIAIDALAIGYFFNTFAPGPDPRILGTGVVVAITAAHAFDLYWAKHSQNLLVIVKVAFLLGFVALAVTLTDHAVPTWSPPGGGEGFPWQALVRNQFWIAFAFSGWNAAIYASGEFRDPRRQVPRAMLIGCGFVALVYLLVNWIFVANIGPEEAQVVFAYEQTRVTLGHVIGSKLFGSAGGTGLSIFVIIAFVSAMSAMTMVGPRVYAAMAKDGYLPRAFVGEDDRPPLLSVLLQSAVALVLVHTHSLLDAVSATSSFLMVFSALTALTVFRIRKVRPELPAPRPTQLLAAVFYAACVVVILAIGLRMSTAHWLSIGGVGLAATVAFLLTRKPR